MPALRDAPRRDLLKERQTAMRETDEARWEVIATASGMMQANIIRGRLDDPIYLS